MTRKSAAISPPVWPQVDWIVIDDTYLQWYQHLPASENAVLKQYYQDLFEWRSLDLFRSRRSRRILRCSERVSEPRPG